MPFFCNFPLLFALVCGWKLYQKKYMSLTKISSYRLSKQFVNQITLLCDGKCHCNAAKTVLRQLIVAYHLNGNIFIERLFFLWAWITLLKPRPGLMLPLYVTTVNWYVTLALDGIGQPNYTTDAIEIYLFIEKPQCLIDTSVIWCRVQFLIELPPYK